MKTKKNTKPLDNLYKRCRKTCFDYVKELDQEYHIVIADTYAFADIGLTNQDIIWSGALKASQKMSIENGKNIKVKWEWDPSDPDSGYHYANNVLKGFHAWGTGRFIPGRNWPEKSVERLEPISFLLRKLK